MNLYSMIPKVDQILENQLIIELISNNSKKLIMESIHEELNLIREFISNGATESEVLERINSIFSNIKNNVENRIKYNLKCVINATGVVIHTNLGRSVLTSEILDNMCTIAINYSNLEYDLENGERGSRYSHLKNKDALA